MFMGVLYWKKVSCKNFKKLFENALNLKELTVTLKLRLSLFLNLNSENRYEFCGCCSGVVGVSVLLLSRFILLYYIF